MKNMYLLLCSVITLSMCIGLSKNDIYGELLSTTDMKGIIGGAELRREIMDCSDIEEIEKVLKHH